MNCYDWYGECIVLEGFVCCQPWRVHPVDIFRDLTPSTLLKVCPWFFLCKNHFVYVDETMRLLKTNMLFLSNIL